MEYTPVMNPMMPTRRTKIDESESRWSHRPKASIFCPLESMVPAVTTERTRVAATEMVLSPAKTL
jgi:hypothetical protein